MGGVTLVWLTATCILTHTSSAIDDEIGEGGRPGSAGEAVHGKACWGLCTSRKVGDQRPRNQRPSNRTTTPIMPTAPSMHAHHAHSSPITPTHRHSPPPATHHTSHKAWVRSVAWMVAGAGAVVIEIFARPSLYIQSDDDDDSSYYADPIFLRIVYVAGGCGIHPFNHDRSAQSTLKTPTTRATWYHTLTQQRHAT